MNQQEYSDLISGALSSQDLERLTATYGSDMITAMLRGELQLREAMESIDQSTPGDAGMNDMEWSIPERTTFDVLTRYSGWLIVLGVVVTVSALAALAPRILQGDGSVSARISDPLTWTIAVVLIIGVGAMLLLERSDDV